MPELPRNGGCSPSLQQLQPQTPTKLGRGKGEGLETGDYEKALSTNTIPPSPTRPPQSFTGVKRQQDQQRDEQLSYGKLPSSVTTENCKGLALNFPFKNNSKLKKYTVENYIKFHNTLQLHSDDVITNQSLLNNNVDMQIEHHHQTVTANDNQYAFAMVFHEKGEGVISEKAYPFDQKKKGKKKDNYSKNRNHSEEKLIEFIDDYLANNNNVIEGGCVLIYTFYSPCLNRCMKKIGEKSFEWCEKYRMMTIVYFTMYWGIDGPKNLDKYNNNDEMKCNERYNQISFTLNREHLKDKIQKEKLFTIFSGPEYEERKSDNAKLRRTIEEFQALPEELLQEQKIAEHLKKGERHILSIEYPSRYKSDIQLKLFKILKETIKVSLGQRATEIIKTDYNVRIVKYYVRELKSSFGDDCPLQMCWLEKARAEDLHQLYSRDEDD